MQWLIQDTNVPIMHIDQNGVRLLEAVKERNLSWHAIGQIPFSYEPTGMEEIDLTQPWFLYGSTQMTEMAASWPCQNPGVFWGDGWFDPRNWVCKRSDLLNEHCRTVSVRDIRSRWVDEPMFAKSVTVKALTGMVLEPTKEDKDIWTIEHSDLNGDDQLVLSPVVTIDREWRWFVMDGEIVTGSTYRKDGYKSIRHPISVEARSAAERAIKEWMPSENIVIDICRTREGEYKVVEFNSINSSGFYNSDIGKLVDRIESKYR